MLSYFGFGSRVPKCAMISQPWKSSKPGYVGPKSGDPHTTPLSALVHLLYIPAFFQMLKNLVGTAVC